MESINFIAPTIDDLLNNVINAILTYGDEIKPTKGAARELIGVMLELTNPRARLSRTENRGKIFSCLGEFFWYLSGKNNLDFISYYIPEYKNFAEDNLVSGGYGPRLFGENSKDQVHNIIKILKRKPESRQAVIQIFDSNDIMKNNQDVPCTCTLQFMIRNNLLHTIVYMRSNDVFIGLPHDIFCFTLLQELIANDLNVEIGRYKHMVGSLHLYNKDIKKAQYFLNEGWQSTTLMPKMPKYNLWNSIEVVKKFEEYIRTEKNITLNKLENIDDYWVDIILLLYIFNFSKKKDIKSIKEIQKRISSNQYNIFIAKKINELESEIE